MALLTNIFKSEYKHSVLKAWMTFFSVFVAIAIILMGTYFFNVNSILSNNLSAYNSVKMAQTREKIDSTITDMAITAEKIASSEDIQKYISNIQNTESIENQQNLMSSLGIYLENNRHLSDIVIMLPRKEFVVTSMASVHQKYYHSAYFDPESFSYLEWQEFFNKRHDRQYTYLEMRELGGFAATKFVYINDMGEQNGSIMLILNSDNLSAIDPYYYKIIMINSDNKPITTLRLDETIPVFNYNDMTKEEAEYKITKDSYVSYAKSIIPSLKYLLFTDKKIFLNDLNKMQSVSIISICLYLVIGLLLAWLFSKRQYTQIQGILKILKDSTNVNEKNEYTKIKNSISNIIDENVVISSENYKKDYYMKERYVVNLLKGRNSTTSIQGMETFQDGLMTVVRLTIITSNNEFPYDSDLTFFALKNVSEEIFSKLGTVHSAEIDGMIILIIRFKDENDIESKLLSASNELLDALKVYLNIESEIILGRIIQSIADIPSCYEDVLDASLMLNTDIGKIIQASEIMERNRSDYSYSLEKELEIITYVKNGDYDSAYNLITKEIDDMLYNKKFPIYLLRCFMIDLESTVLKALSEVERSSGKRMQEKFLNVSELFRCHSISKMKDTVCRSLREICDFVIDTHSSGSELCENIKQYIRSNFSNMDLNVNEVARNFYMNPTYLSGMFKKNTGVKLLEYINMVRTEEAKTIMLKHPSLSMEIVAEMAGFSNTRTFRRVFAKYESVPPKKFVKK